MLLPIINTVITADQLLSNIVSLTTIRLIGLAFSALSSAVTWFVLIPSSKNCTTLETCYPFEMPEMLYYYVIGNFVSGLLGLPGDYLNLKVTKLGDPSKLALDSDI